MTLGRPSVAVALLQVWPPLADWKTPTSVPTKSTLLSLSGRTARVLVKISGSGELPPVPLISLQMGANAVVSSQRQIWGVPVPETVTKMRFGSLGLTTILVMERRGSPPGAPALPISEKLSPPSAEK